MRRLPFLAIIILPFPLETRLITVLHPILRFFQVNGLRACVQRPLDADPQKFSVIGPRTKVKDVPAAAVKMAIAVAIGLFLVFMVHAVETAMEIILILAPCYPGHNMNPVAMLAPGLDALRQVGTYPVSD